MKIVFLGFDGVMDTARYDGSNFNEHQLSHLVVVNPVKGLDEVAAERAIEKLNKNNKNNL